MFISFEGVDGSGKSSQARTIAEWLGAQGYETVLTREPGGTKGAEELRALVLNGAGDRWSAMSEILLFTAARRDHVERVIWPAITSGKIVITDRFADSTRLYQGLVDAKHRAAVDAIHNIAIGFEPDLTLVFDIDPHRAAARIAGRDDLDMRFEGHGLDFQIARRTGFLQLAHDNPERVEIVNADQGFDAVTADLRAIITPRLVGRNQ